MRLWAVNVFEQVEVLSRITYKTSIACITPVDSIVANQTLSASMAPWGATSETSETELTASHHDMASCMQLTRMQHMERTIGIRLAYSARFSRAKHMQHRKEKEGAVKADGMACSAEHKTEL